MVFKFFYYFFRNFLRRVEYERHSRVKFFCHFFRNSSLGRVRMEFGGKVFFLFFSAYLIPFWLEIMSERGFLIFSIFLLFFSEFSCPSRVWTEFGSNIFFFSFFACRKVGFKFFKFFYNFFRNFLGQVEYERHSGVKFFCHFFRNFLAWVEYERNSGVKFFFFFSAYLIPFWLKLMSERGF